MIKIENSDSIVDILSKISKESSDKIILQFPFGHPVLHNYLSLKIIQTKARKKTLLILTNDRTSQKIGKTLGISYSKNIHESAEKHSTTKHNSLKENYSFFEYAQYELKRYIRVVYNLVSKNKTLNSIQYTRRKHLKTNPNIFIYLLLILIIISSILLYVYYFAINKTIVEITPEISIKIKARNYTYIEKDLGIIENEIFNDNEIGLEKISEITSIKRIFQSSGLKQKENNTAEGIVEFQNFFEKDISLLTHTTLENKEGVQFITKDIITLPGAKKTDTGVILPGATQAKIYGKIKLLNGDYSGEKANVGSGILLTIPKLGKDKTKIFAKTITDFQGGSNDFTKIVTHDDLKNSEKMMKEILQQEAIKGIKKIVERNNTQNNIGMGILPVDNIYKFENINVELPEHIIPGDEIDNFTINGTIKVTSYAYNVEAVMSKLKAIITDSSITGTEKIENINPTSLRISHVIKRNDLKNTNGKYSYIQTLDEPLKIKGTTEIEYYVSKKFENTQNYFNHTLKSSISGLEKEKAERILLNNPEINNVKIDIQPFFLNTISKIPENIIIKVVE